MCLMTARYTEACGGQTVMTNMTELLQRPGGIELIGLLDEPVTLPGVRVDHIDFSHGLTWLVREDALGKETV